MVVSVYSGPGPPAASAAHTKKAASEIRTPPTASNLNTYRMLLPKAYGMPCHCIDSAWVQEGRTIRWQGHRHNRCVAATHSGQPIAGAGCLKAIISGHNNRIAGTKSGCGPRSGRPNRQGRRFLARNTMVAKWPQVTHRE